MSKLWFRWVIRAIMAYLWCRQCYHYTALPTYNVWALVDFLVLLHPQNGICSCEHNPYCTLSFCCLRPVKLDYYMHSTTCVFKSHDSWSHVTMAIINDRFLDQKSTNRFILQPTQLFRNWWYILKTSLQWIQIPKKLQGWRYRDAMTSMCINLFCTTYLTCINKDDAFIIYLHKFEMYWMFFNSQDVCRMLILNAQSLVDNLQKWLCDQK